jgi:hypothetical protein
MRTLLRRKRSSIRQQSGFGWVAGGSSVIKGGGALLLLAWQFGEQRRALVPVSDVLQIHLQTWWFQFLVLRTWTRRTSERGREPGRLAATRTRTGRGSPNTRVLTIGGALSLSVRSVRTADS